jgi:hypothetical protein
MLSLERTEHVAPPASSEIVGEPERAGSEKVFKNVFQKEMRAFPEGTMPFLEGGCRKIT